MDDSNSTLDDGINHVTIEDFNNRLYRISTTGSTVVFAKSGAGKSSMIRNILYIHRFVYDVIIYISPTMDIVSKIRRVMPACVIYHTTDIKIITKIMDFLNDPANQTRDMFNGNNLTKKINVAVILDDVMDVSTKADKNIIKAIKRGRHVLAIYMIIHLYKELDPGLRGNVHHIFQGRIEAQDIEDAYKSWWRGIFPGGVATFAKLVSNLKSGQALVSSSLQPDDIQKQIKTDIIYHLIRLCKINQRAPQLKKIITEKEALIYSDPKYDIERNAKAYVFFEKSFCNNDVNDDADNDIIYARIFKLQIYGHVKFKTLYKELGFKDAYLSPTEIYNRDYKESAAKARVYLFNSYWPIRLDPLLHVDMWYFHALLAKKSVHSQTNVLQNTNNHSSEDPLKKLSGYVRSNLKSGGENNNASKQIIMEKLEKKKQKIMESNDKKNKLIVFRQTDSKF